MVEMITREPARVRDVVATRGMGDRLLVFIMLPRRFSF
jgi:hypothetical protein